MEKFPDGWVLTPKVEGLTISIEKEELVMCRSCKHAHMTYYGECKYCDLFASKESDGELDETLYLPPGFYCAFGEKEEQHE